jgi:hypothetical protein
MRTFSVGDRVRIERDESRYPSRGTWPQFRGRTGTVVEINVDRKRPQLTEYGVAFGKTRTRPDGSLHGDDATTWFKAHELSALGSVRHAERHIVGAQGVGCPMTAVWTTQANDELLGKTDFLATCWYNLGDRRHDEVAAVLLDPDLDLYDGVFETRAKAQAWAIATDLSNDAGELHVLPGAATLIGARVTKRRWIEVERPGLLELYRVHAVYLDVEPALVNCQGWTGNSWSEPTAVTGDD